MTRSDNESSIISARMAAYRGLWEIFENSAYANLVIQQILRRYSFRAEDRRFLTELIYGVCRRYNFLLWMIGQFSCRPVKKIDAKVRILLCLGLYQLIFLDSVPDSAAVNETVKLGKKVTHEGNTRFINAVLRSYLRGKDKIAIPSEEENPVLHDALTYNQPEWLIRRWSREWGREKARAVLAAMNEIAPLDIRCNTLKISRKELLERLEAAGAQPAEMAACEEGIVIQKGDAFFQTDLLQKGLAYIQNRASMLPAAVLAPKPGERILDMCAAPGSKTTQAAARMHDQGQIDAWDIYPHKIRLIQDNCRRLGIESIKAVVHDASKFDQTAENAYDGVLLDAPCSGLGVLRRKTELRWRRKENELDLFPALQKKLLACAARYVRPGGRLVYSTCTLNAEENEKMVAGFLRDHPEYETAPIELPGISAAEGMITLWPDIHHSDGFFVANLVRRTAE